MRLKIVVICGPTGSGKTKFAIKLASRFNGEIVSADSMQVYKYMDIGTAKATYHDRKIIPHHMLDIVDPDQNFDAAIYSKLARHCIAKIMKNGRNVFVVGGSGLYIKALIMGLFENNSIDYAIRGSLEKEIIENGSKKLHEKLLKVDEISGNKIHSNDTFRIQRALEIFRATGKTKFELENRDKNKTPFYATLYIGMLWSRSDLYQRINFRVDNMIQCGLVNEVKTLLLSGYNSDLKSMKALGYRHIIKFLNNSESWERILNILKRDHRRYAKRQITWFNANHNINWLRVDEISKAKRIIKKFYNL